MSNISNNWSEKICFIASEAKDVYCLIPLSSLINQKIYIINALTKTDIDEILSAEKPIFVCASHIALGFLEAIRPRNSFIAIGIEHGLAPFKAYTYSEKLLDYDLYCAPTEAWAERLRHLYKEKADRILTTGYPRLETLKALREAINNNEASSQSSEWQHTTDTSKILVVFSWGVNADSLRILPDLDNIVYLLHPADEYLVTTVDFKNAALLASSPSVTSTLLAHADIVYGDFSSMTIEAEVLGLPVQMFVCRKLYRFDCDVGDSFFNPSLENFLKVPHYHKQIDAENVIKDIDSLIGNLIADAGRKKSFKNESIFPVEFYPPMQSAVSLCMAALNNIALKIEDGAFSLSKIPANEAANVASALNFLISAYKTILGRSPDVGGIRTYMNDFRANKEPGPLWSLKVIKEFAYSREGQNHWQNSPKKFAMIHFPS